MLIEKKLLKMEVSYFLKSSIFRQYQLFPHRLVLNLLFHFLSGTECFILFKEMSIVNFLTMFAITYRRMHHLYTLDTTSAILLYHNNETQ